jgi:hypothetical protein
MTENPEEYKKWQEWIKERETKPDQGSLDGIRVLPI